MSSTRDLPPLRVMPKQLEAACYNQVRLALRRLGEPLSVSLPGHRGLDMLLARTEWVCLDTISDDFPVMAWKDFARAGVNLHEPVSCRLELYHRCAGLVMGTALDALVEALDGRLGHASSDKDGHASR